MSGPPRARAPYASVPALLAVLVVVAAVLAIGTWSATSGPEQVFAGEGNDIGVGPFSPPTSVTPSGIGGSHGMRPTDKDYSRSGTALDGVVKVLIALLVLAAVLVLLRAWWRDRARYRTPLRTPEDVDLDAVDPVARARAALTDDARRQAALLAEGTPGNAVVACWQRFEGQARVAGVPRLDWETSTEFTQRLLALVDADPDAVASLAALFRRARFSDHDLTEADRSAALAALSTIHADLDRPAGRAT